MRARLRRKLERPFVELFRYAWDRLPNYESPEAKMVVAHWVLFRADMACYRETGKPLIPGIRWVKGEEYPIAFLAYRRPRRRGARRRPC